jgi:hypothetical protein
VDDDVPQRVRQPQEARADFCSRTRRGHAVSLWINGVEQQARFGSPQKVRAAYQEIAVVQRRDPLLVTMPAPDHLLVQCFPVPANGEMKIKSVSPPASLGCGQEQSSKLVADWPAFGPVNFEVPSASKLGWYSQPNCHTQDHKSSSDGRRDVCTEPIQVPGGSLLSEKQEMSWAHALRLADPSAAPSGLSI